MALHPFIEKVLETGRAAGVPTLPHGFARPFNHIEEADAAIGAAAAQIRRHCMAAMRG